MNSRTFVVVAFLALLVFDTFTQVCLKLTANHAANYAELVIQSEPTIQSELMAFDLQWLIRALTTPWVYCAVIGYLATFVTWMLVLRHIPVGPAVAASHLEVVGVMIVSVPIFGEVLTWVQYLGAALILTGVFCLAYGEPNYTPGGKMKESH
ncbi:MAG: EamA family transporter [Betaproteobacteria bacterium]|nr:EamA family transporter [Betaproteobacteria bacterium]MCL2162412.1 EamA family transporter [Betaproteobacteria bacterium]